MSTSLSELLFKDYRRRVLSLLLLHPEKQYHVREIARLTGAAAGTLHKELAKLAEAGVLKKAHNANLVLYSANRECPIYDELASILRKTGEQDVAVMTRRDNIVIAGSFAISRKALRGLAQQFRIRRLVLFGSAARGELTPESDIDLLIEFERGQEPSLGGLVKIQDALIRLFGGRKVDIATPSILNNPYRRRAIEKDMEELYAA